MTSRDFCYWLQGYFEIMWANRPAQGTPEEGLNRHQVDVIRKHLNMVFLHEIDPSFPAEQQKALDDAHKPSNPNELKFRC